MITARNNPRPPPGPGVFSCHLAARIAISTPFIHHFYIAGPHVLCYNGVGIGLSDHNNLYRRLHARMATQVIEARDLIVGDRSMYPDGGQAYVVLEVHVVTAREARRLQDQTDGAIQPGDITGEVQWTDGGRTNRWWSPDAQVTVDR